VQQQRRQRLVVLDQDHVDASPVVDAINFRDYLFDLTVDLARASQSVSPAVRAEDRRLTREQVEQVARYYRFSP
jgi:hypothetical protein